MSEKRLNKILADIQAGRYEMTENGVWISGERLLAGGVFDINAKRHIDVIRAIEDGDPEREAWARQRALLATTGFETVDASHDPNLMPAPGINFFLNLLVGAAIKKGAWYPSAFRNNVTPDDTWDANWAGASSGPKGQEINAGYVTASARAAASFGTAASKSITMSAAVEYTVKSGVTDLAVYGGTLNSSSAFGYDTAYDGANGHVLLAATKRASAVTGLAAGDKINISYTLSATSS